MTLTQCLATILWRSRRPGKVMITADIPLAARTDTSEVSIVLNPRGELYSAGEHSIAVEYARFPRHTALGREVITGGPAPFSQADRMAFFSNQFPPLLASFRFFVVRFMLRPRYGGFG